MPQNRVLSTVVSIVIGVALAWAIQAFLLKPYAIPSESMEKTLMPGERVLVDRISKTPEYGKIMVFYPPANAVSQQGCIDGRSVSYLCDVPGKTKADQPYIKRVVALGGDRVSFKNGKVYRNGEMIDEPYAEPCPGFETGCSFKNEITVPKGYVYMIGDNRNGSYDSRFWGPVPESWFVGTARWIYWPPSSLGGI